MTTSSSNAESSKPSHKSLHQSFVGNNNEGDGGRRSVLRKLYIATALCFVFLLVEVVGGWLAGSLAILSDASHLFADLASFCVAIVASHLASLPSTVKHTFGLRRAESLAALISMFSLAVVSIGLAVEALRRLFGKSPTEKDVDGPLMSGIAAIGVLVNVVLAFVLGEDHVHMPGTSDHHDHSHDEHSHDHGHDHHHQQNQDHSHDNIPTETCEADEQGLLSHAAAHHHSFDSYDAVLHANEVLPIVKKEENISLQASRLHVLGDLAQSLAVLVAGVILWIFPKAQIVDPLCTLLFCMLVFYSTLSILRTSVAVLLEEIPPQIDWMKVYEAISAVPDIYNVHDLHIWCISHGEPSLSVHCVSERSDPDEALKDIYSICRQFGISHATIQLQHSRDHCITCQGQAW